MKNQNYTAAFHLIFKSKAIYAVIFAGIVVIACQQNQPAPSGNNATTAGGGSTTSGSTTGGGATPGTVAAQQQMIKGNWILRQTQVFQQVTTNGVTKDSMLRYENHYSPSTCFLDLQSQPSSNPGYYVANGSLYCNPISAWWRITTLNQLDLGSIYIIEHLSTDSLVLYSGGGGLNKTKSILNKTGYAPGLNNQEMQIAKNWNLVKTEAGGIVTTAYNGAGAFLNQWNNMFGWKISGYTSLGWSFNSWQVVQGRFSIGGQHYKIDTLTANKFVITSFSTTTIGSNPPVPNYRYTFQ